MMFYDSDDSRYQCALDAFVAEVGGSRYELANPLARSGVKSGRDADEILSDLEARMKLESKHRYYIRRDVAYWKGRITPGGFRFRPWTPHRWHPKPVAQDTGEVRRMISEGGGRASFETLMEVSPCQVKGMTPTSQSSSFLRLLWSPGDLLYVTHKGRERGRLGDNIRSAADWANAVETFQDIGGDIVTPNPLTGRSVRREGERGEYDSFICKECLARPLPYLLAEMDHQPLEVQAAFWLGFIKASPLAQQLVSLVFSGTRSIHALLTVDAQDEETWQEHAQHLGTLYATDPTEEREQRGDGTVRTVYPYRMDVAAMQPLTKTRIPGVHRLDNGEVQRLLYLNPRSVHECQ